MDTNNDGTLDQEELKAGMKEHMSAMYFDVCDWEDFIDSIDADKNGIVDFQEFVTAAHNRNKMLNE